MWIISNDHNTMVNLTGTLSIGDNKECYSLVHDGVALGAYRNRGEVRDIIVKVAELLDGGVRPDYVYEMPSNTYPATRVYQEAQNSWEGSPMSAFNSLPNDVI